MGSHHDARPFEFGANLWNEPIERFGLGFLAIDMAHAPEEQPFSRSRYRKSCDGYGAWLAEVAKKTANRATGYMVSK